MDGRATNDICARPIKRKKEKWMDKDAEQSEEKFGNVERMIKT